jgi:acyl-CoA reductase-like NAD-dependent aldehyde dehydrogenase
MTMADFRALVSHHRNYFRSGATQSSEWRANQLAALKSMMKDYAEDFYMTLWTDLHRNRVDADLTDVRYITGAVDHVLAHLLKWMKPLPVSTPIMLAPSHGHVRYDPRGVGLIIGAWNYPVMLTVSRLIAAIAGGNTAVIKPSEMAAATADVVARRIPEYLDRDAFSVVPRSAPETTALLEQQWDHIFFTGGTSVAKIVMAVAAISLTPVLLELGGTIQAIVHSSADLRAAARRVTQGRWTNAGQTCTAPDYVLVDKDVVGAFLEQLHEAVVQFYSEDPQKSADYGRIINLHNFDRRVGLLANGEIYHGGQYDRADRYIAPTVLVNVSADSPVMQEEIFGPILPILEVGNVQEAIDFASSRPSPPHLGLYS